MNKKDLIVVLAVAAIMAPFTYFAGERAWGWDSQWGLSYLVANVVVPVVLAALIFMVRSKKK